MWPTPTPYPQGDTSNLPELPALDQAGTDIAESLVAGYNVVSAVPFMTAVAYLFVVMVFFFCLWTIAGHWKRI